MVRIFYFLLWVIQHYTTRIYFRKTVVVNRPFEIYGRTIYVSNHAAAFMDPIALGPNSLPILFFLTRSDVFTPLTKPFLWGAHMLPIYRKHDGEDTKSKNDEVFDKSAQVLRYGRNLLIYGEGFTDDTFVRRLKPVKKGAIRIGFYTLEKYNWSIEVKVAAIGINYTEPNRLRSELLIANSEKFCLNDYKDAYLENPNKVITELTKKVESMMQEQITHVQDSSLTAFHENLMLMTAKGMHPTESDRSIALIERWKYSKKLAKNINAMSEELKHSDIVERVKIHCRQSQKMGVTFKDIQQIKQQKSIETFDEILILVALFPFMLLGFVHCWLPYKLVKNYAEKSFKRKVFWGSVKLLLGSITIGVYNIILLCVIGNITSITFPWLFTYFLAIGPFFIAMIRWKKAWYDLHRKKLLTAETIRNIANEREVLLKELTTKIGSL